jgi:hypothetical protein
MLHAHAALAISSAPSVESNVLFGDPQDFCDCLVWDLGRSAATIEIGPDTALPTAFRLVSEGLRLDERCLVIWREDRKLGLKFAS